VTTEQIIIVIAVAIIFVIAARGLRRGARITQITRTVKRDEPGEG
jgi:hypothetical protein